MCLAFLTLFARGQEPFLHFEKINTQNGLSHNKVNCILQDKRGFIWFGTDDGLNSYDGHNFLLFRNRPNDSTSISGNIITALLEDKDERLWIATADGGLSRFDYRQPPGSQFRQYKHLPGQLLSIPTNIINDLIEDPAGFLWLATSGHAVLRFDKRSETFKAFLPRGIKTTVFSLCLDRNGIIWAGREGGGILKIDPRSCRLEEDRRYWNLYAKLPHAAVTRLFMDGEKNIWFGSWDNVLYRQNASTGREEVFSEGGPYTFRNDEILSFAEDAYGRLWMGGSKKGLHIYDKRSGRFYHHSYDPAKGGSISDNRVNCLFRDRSGRIWIGTNKGVCVNHPRRQQFAQTFLPGGEASLPLTIYDFYEDENKQLFIGTSEGIYIQKEGEWHKKTLSYKGNPLQVTSFYRDAKGSFYLGTDYSFFRYEPATNKLAPLPNTEKDGVMNRIIDSRVVSILEDSIGSHPVLLAVPYGHFLAYYDLVKNKWVSRLDSTMKIIRRFNLKDNLIRKLFKTRDGTIWVATAKTGLGFWKPGDTLPALRYYSSNPADSRSLANNNVYDMAEDNLGNLWVSTYGGGLHYLNTKDGSFTQIASSNNLVEGLQTDHHENVWMISNGSLHKYDPKRRSYTSYDLPDLERTGGVKGKIFKDSRGRLYAAGTNYFIAFHPDSVLDIQTSPKVYLTGFSIFNNSFSHLLYKDAIELNYRDNYFAFEFAAPDFASGAQVQYSYMLEGFDRDWVDAGGRNYVPYSNLEGGEYTFKVRATNTPGTWSKEYASVRIVIIPPFWKRPWFYMLCALVLAIAIYAIYRYRINELLKRQAIRNRIAQDLHDNVGSTLSSISVYSQVAKIYHKQDKQVDLEATLEKISSTSSDMISELNDTVWAINPRNDNMEVILQRMESFARPLLASQQIELRFHYDKPISSINLDMEKRKNFYLIFKEVVNNTLKYADCSRLEVSIEQKGNTIHTIINDDGKGFDLKKTSEGYKSSDVYGGGNGLRNMQLRAKEMKGQLRLYSEPGKGTTVAFHFPIT
ncbi:MAG TPA: two-component regulator propeller domain-containing protein [Flavisolibacter sp.]|nr:two-component regulator propeller domain-containing protein [Flavisolibacter sp.]